MSDLLAKLDALSQDIAIPKATQSDDDLFSNFEQVSGLLDSTANTQQALLETEQAKAKRKDAEAEYAAFTKEKERWEKAEAGSDTRNFMPFEETSGAPRELHVGFGVMPGSPETAKALGSLGSGPKQSKELWKALSDRARTGESLTPDMQAELDAHNKKLIEPTIDHETGNYSRGQAPDSIFQYITTKMPFVGGAAEIAWVGDVYKSAQAIQNGTANQTDYNTIVDFQRLNKEAEDAGWFGKVMDVVTDMPAFAIELGMTGGATGVIKGGSKKVAKEAVKRTVMQTVKNATKRFAIAAATVAAKGAVLTPLTTQPQRSMARVIGRDILQAKGAGHLDPTNENKRELKTYWEAAPEAMINAFGEVSSEMAGALLRPGANAARSGIAKLIPAKAKAFALKWLNGRGTKTAAAAAQKLAEKGQWHGFLEEWGEERLNDFAQGVMLSVLPGEQPGEDFGSFGQVARTATGDISALGELAKEQAVEIPALAIPGLGGAAFAGATGLARGDRYDDILKKMEMPEDLIATLSRAQKRYEVIDRSINTSADTMLETPEGRAALQKVALLKSPSRTQIKESGLEIPINTNGRERKGISQWAKLRLEAHKAKQAREDAAQQAADPVTQAREDAAQQAADPVTQARDQIAVDRAVAKARPPVEPIPAEVMDTYTSLGTEEFNADLDAKLQKLHDEMPTRGRRTKERRALEAQRAGRPLRDVATERERAWDEEAGEPGRGRSKERAKNKRMAEEAPLGVPLGQGWQYIPSTTEVPDNIDLVNKHVVEDGIIAQPRERQEKPDQPKRKGFQRPDVPVRQPTSENQRSQIEQALVEDHTPDNEAAVARAANSTDRLEEATPLGVEQSVQQEGEQQGPKIPQKEKTDIPSSEVQDKTLEVDVPSEALEGPLDALEGPLEDLPVTLPHEASEAPATEITPPAAKAEPAQEQRAPAPQTPQEVTPDAVEALRTDDPAKAPPRNAARPVQERPERQIGRSVAKLQQHFDSTPLTQGTEVIQEEDRLRVMVPGRGEYSIKFDDGEIQAGIEAGTIALDESAQAEGLEPGEVDVNAVYDRATKTIVIRPGKGSQTTVHEIVHAMQDFGLFTKAELGLYSPGTAGLEEMAVGWSRWDATGRPTNPISSLYHKIADFLQALAGFKGARQRQLYRDIDKNGMRERCLAGMRQEPPTPAVMAQVEEAVAELTGGKRTNSEKIFLHWKYGIWPRMISAVREKLSFKGAKGLAVDMPTTKKGKTRLISKAGAAFDAVVNWDGLRHAAREFIKDVKPYFDANTWAADYYARLNALEFKSLKRRWNDITRGEYRFFQLLNAVASARTELKENTAETLEAFSSFRTGGRVDVEVGELDGRPAPAYKLTRGMRETVAAMQAIDSGEHDTEYYRKQWGLTRQRRKDGTYRRNTVDKLHDEWTRLGPTRFRQKKRSGIVIHGGPAMYNKARNYNAVNLLIEKFDGDVGKMTEWLQVPVTKQELEELNKELGWASIGALADIRDTVYCATGQSELIPRTFVFGPKVGAYAMNRLGDGRYNTMDVWESRAWRSFFIDMNDESTGISEGIQRRIYMRAANVFAEEWNKMFPGSDFTVSAGQALRWFYIMEAMDKAGYSKARSNKQTIAEYVEGYIDQYLAQRVAGVPAQYVNDAGHTTLYVYSSRIDSETQRRDPHEAIRQPRGYSRNEYDSAQTPRTFFYLNPTRDKESMVRGWQFATEVHASEIYDAMENREDFPSHTDDPDAFFEALQNAGYKGAYYKTGGMEVVTMLRDVQVERQYNSPDDYLTHPRVRQALLGVMEMASAAADGGFTYDPGTGKMRTKGKAVAVNKTTERRVSMKPVWGVASKIRDYVQDHAEAIAQPEACVGGWVDSDGMLVLDIPRVVRTKTQAVKLGRQHLQEYYYDLTKRVEVPVMTREEIEAEQKRRGGLASVSASPSAVVAAAIKHGAVDFDQCHEYARRTLTPEQLEDAEDNLLVFWNACVAAWPNLNLVHENPAQASTGGTGTVYTAPPTAEIGRRFRRSHGTRKPSELGEWASKLWRQLTRASIHLPNTPQFSAAKEFFRLLKGSRSIAGDKTKRNVADIVRSLTDPRDLEQFEHTLIARNMLRARDLGQSPRFGFDTWDEVEAWSAELEADSATNPAVIDALNRREAVLEEVKQEMVDLGLMDDEILGDSDYYHQQVIGWQTLYTQAQASGAKRAVKATRDFMLRRSQADLRAEEFDYNTNYLEAESRFLCDAHDAIYKENLLNKFIRSVYDRKSDFVAFASSMGDGSAWRNAVAQSDQYGIWQAQPGTTMYETYSLPDQIVEQILLANGDEVGIDPSELRKILAVGGQREELVLPTQVIQQLNEVQRAPAEEHPILVVARKFNTFWKKMILFSPTRFLRYSIGNIGGDLDGYIGAIGITPTPSGVRQAMTDMTEASIELAQYVASDKYEPSVELQLARDHCVVESGFASSDMSEFVASEEFEMLTTTQKGLRLMNPLKAWSSYFNFAAKMNEWRENVMRYAAFKKLLREYQAGNYTRVGTGFRPQVEALATHVSPACAAAHVARNALGDYGDLTVTGEWIRRHVYPFWSWTEVNTKRYGKLFANTLREPFHADNAARAVWTATSLGARMFMLYGLSMAWNMMMFPDDEEFLSEYDRTNPHINLGRSHNGEVVCLRNFGALGDAMDFFSPADLVVLAKYVKNGQLTPGEGALEWWKGGMGAKLFGGLRADLQLIWGLSSGTLFYEGPWNLRKVNVSDIPAQIFGVQDEYKMIKGMVCQDGTRMNPGYWRKFFRMGVSLPGRTASRRINDAQRRWKGSKGDEDTSIHAPSKYQLGTKAAEFGNQEAFREWRKKFVKDEAAQGIDFPQVLKNFDRKIAGLEFYYGMDEAEQKEFNEFIGPDRRFLDMAREYDENVRNTFMMYWWGDIVRNGTDEEKTALKNHTRKKAVGTSKQKGLYQGMWKEYYSADAPSAGPN